MFLHVQPLPTIDRHHLYSITCTDEFGRVKDERGVSDLEVAIILVVPNNEVKDIIDEFD